MPHGRVTTGIRRKLEAIVGEGNLLYSREAMEDYSHDEFSPQLLRAFPEAVVKPQTAGQVCAIMGLASEESIPVTPRGGGTGLTGACVPSQGGIVLALEKMKKVIEIDDDNMMATIESGLTLGEFYEHIAARGLFFPPHPGDESAQIGGVIATNAGGARAVKYGVIRNFVRGLEVVTPRGELLHIGGKLLKNSSGYNLLNLVIGSEGTLCVVTRATISLITPPKVMQTLVIPFADLHQAVGAIPKIMKAGILPLAVEFIDKDVIFATEHYLQKTWPSRNGTADLMFVLDGGNEDAVMRDAEAIGEICLSCAAIDVLVADTRERQADILKMRSEMYQALKAHTVEILDVCVPRSSTALYVDRVHELEKKYGVWLPTVGHAADGNVHTQIMRARWSGGGWTEIAGVDWAKTHPAIAGDIHLIGRELGGVISGEHGIGLAKMHSLAGSIGEGQVDVMRAIKKALDPANLMNPGKIFTL